jgi:hypothetical protein
MARLGSPGCRPNRCLESLALTPSGRFLWSALELPDGSWGALDPDRSTPTQLFRWRVDGAKLTPDRRVSYPLEPAPRPVRGHARERENGLVELLALADDHLLALERGVALEPGVNVAVRLFEVDTVESTSPPRREGAARPAAVPAAKRLVLDLETLAPRLTPPRLDNYEGMSWGPPSPQGHRTLLLVSDDNASPTQRTSFVWLEIVPRKPLGHAPAATPMQLRH